MQRLPPELFAHAAINDDINRRIDDDEQMVEVDQDVKCERNVIPAEPAAMAEVVQRVVLRIGDLVDPQGQAVRVADDEGQHDGHQDDGRLLTAFSRLFAELGRRGFAAGGRLAPGDPRAHAAPQRRINLRRGIPVVVVISVSGRGGIRVGRRDFDGNFVADEPGFSQAQGGRGCCGYGCGCGGSAAVLRGVDGAGGLLVVVAVHAVAATALDGHVVGRRVRAESPHFHHVSSGTGIVFRRSHEPFSEFGRGPNFEVNPEIHVAQGYQRQSPGGQQFVPVAVEPDVVGVLH